MSLHPANFRAVGIGQFLEKLDDEELVSAIAQAHAILRKRERARRDDFNRAVMDAASRAAQAANTAGGQ